MIQIQISIHSEGKALNISLDYLRREDASPLEAQIAKALYELNDKRIQQAAKKSKIKLHITQIGERGQG